MKSNGRIRVYVGHTRNTAQKRSVDGSAAEVLSNADGSALLYMPVAVEKDLERRPCLERFYYFLLGGSVTTPNIAAPMGSRPLEDWATMHGGGAKAAAKADKTVHGEVRILFFGASERELVPFKTCLPSAKFKFVLWADEADQDKKVEKIKKAIQTLKGSFLFVFASSFSWNVGFNGAVQAATEQSLEIRKYDENGASGTFDHAHWAHRKTVDYSKFSDARPR